MSTLTPAEIRAAGRSRSSHDFAGSIRSHYPFWDAQYRPYLLMALDALPRERFDFAPQPDMLTAHQTLVHIAEAEHVWDDILHGRPPVEWVVERTYTLHWILDHVQEHEIHHRAQLNLYLRMLGVTPPSI